MAFYVIFTSRIFRFRLYSFAESRIMKYNSYKIQQDATMYQNFNIPYLYEAQHVSGDTAHHQEPKTALAATGRVSLLHNLFITEIYEKFQNSQY